MRILWVGTKAPWPPHDGGRLVAWLTIQALHQAGHHVALVAPVRRPPTADDLQALRTACDPTIVTAPPIGSLRAWIATRGSRARPWSAARHAQPAVRRAVADLMAREAFDVVHAEQPHALAACADVSGVPVVLRAHNVETDLWTAAGREGGLRGALARREADRVARWEAESVRRVAATVALTAEDAQGLRALAGPQARVTHVAAPFPPRLERAERPLPGDPAIVAAGSGGWLPNARGLEWFGRDVWPAVARALPRARLHVFGAAAPAAATRHPAPADSREAFPPESIGPVSVRRTQVPRPQVLVDHGPDRLDRVLQHEVPASREQAQRRGRDPPVQALGRLQREVRVVLAPQDQDGDVESLELLAAALEAGPVQRAHQAEEGGHPLGAFEGADVLLQPRVRQAGAMTHPEVEGGSDHRRHHAGDALLRRR